LPTVTETLTINGRSQPGFAGTPLVRVDNASASKLNGLRIQAGQSQVLGLEITRFAVAIRLVGDGNRVQGNLIGTDAAGSAGLGNTTGIRVESGTQNRIGGIASSAPNVISASVNHGIEIVAPATTSTVSGNRIGTNPAGTAALANGTGVRIAGGSTQNVIGGTTNAARNVISGNKEYGIRLMDAGTAQNTVLGNYVGTTADGAGALSNGTGIRADTGAAPNTIGGTTAAARNVISGNASVGVQLDASGMTATRVAGNYIGTTATGTGRLANKLFADVFAANVGNVGSCVVAGDGTCAVPVQTPGDYLVIASLATSHGTLFGGHPISAADVVSSQDEADANVLLNLQQRIP
jgi:trimeric autotransporter adhesin